MQTSAQAVASAPGEWFTLDGTTLEAFGAVAGAALGRDALSPVQSLAILRYLAAHAGADETAGFLSAAESGPVASLRVPGTPIVVNVRVTLLVAAATWLDALATGGAANALLTLSGQASRALAMLDPVSGELCNYLTLAREREGQEAAAVAAATAGSACRHPALACAHRGDGVCTIGPAAVERNLRAMAQRAILKLDGEAAERLM